VEQPVEGLVTEGVVRGDDGTEHRAVLVRDHAYRDGGDGLCALCTGRKETHTTFINEPLTGSAWNPDPGRPAVNEQWVEGESLTLSTGLSDDEIAATALSCAATVYSGTGGSDLDGVLDAADRFMDWLDRDRS
jgi:hypothetical protein